MPGSGPAQSQSSMKSLQMQWVTMVTEVKMRAVVTAAEASGIKFVLAKSFGL